MPEGPHLIAIFKTQQIKKWQNKKKKKKNPKKLENKARLGLVVPDKNEKKGGSKT